MCATCWTPNAETLSIALLDLNGDGQDEIWAANDFADYDQVWEYAGGKWTLAEPFAATSHSTMSTDWGDLSNDGRLELFSTDMNPYDISPQTLATVAPHDDQDGRQARGQRPAADVERAAGTADGTGRDQGPLAG